MAQTKLFLNHQTPKINFYDTRSNKSYFSLSENTFLNFSIFGVITKLQ